MDLCAHCYLNVHVFLNKDTLINSSAGYGCNDSTTKQYIEIVTEQ